MPGLLRADADFRRLWIADGISEVGGSVVVLALPLLAATELRASTWQVALLATAASLPVLLIGLPAGAWVDRLRRRPVMIVADTGRAVVLGWVPVAAVLDLLTIEQLFAVSFLAGIGTVCFDLAHGAYLPSLVGRSRLVEANGRLETNHSVAYSAGPTIGGQLVGWIGAPLAVLATVAGYLWSAGWVAAIRHREPPPPPVPDRNLLREIRDGMRFVLAQPFIRATTLHATTAVLFLATRYAVDVLFLLRTVGLAPGSIGALMTVGGLGAVAGAVLAPRIARRLGGTRSVLVAGIAVGLSSLLIPLTGPGLGLAWYAVGAGGVAFSITASNVISVGLRQMLCPDHLLGRMNASSRFLAWATLPLGGVLGGALGTALGLRTTIWLTGAGLLLASLWLILSPVCRARDLPAAPPDVRAEMSPGPARDGLS
ncbi:MAG: MFS transporter [Natronosporangium sp.]